MIRHEIRQRAPGWRHARAGIPTASQFHRLVTPAKGDPSKQADGYLTELLWEWMTGVPIEKPVTQYMEIGTMLEPKAIKAYEMLTDQTVEPGAFYTTDDGLVGASPDGVIAGGKRGIEVKTHPGQPQDHVAYMLGELDEKYRPQIQGQMYVCEFEGVDLISYDQLLPLVVIPIPRREEYIAKLAAALKQFNERLDECKIRLGRDFGPFIRKTDEPAETKFDITDADVESIIAHHIEAGTWQS